MDYEAVIGLEVHVQLLTETKLFCRCANRFGGTPNTRVCPICLGYPGALPVVNRRAVELATRLALACGCAVAERSSFARKSYFYPDLPKGYQISQNDAPLARHGWLPLARHDRRIPIERMHLEEDAGKLLHHEATDGLGETWVDFNRCGTPLVEIVSAPELSSPDEAHDFLESLRQLVRYTGASDGNLEEGSLRCDANVSLRGRGSASTGTRVEIKNLNSFRFVARALEHEIERQGEILARGGKVAAETRSFDTATGKTRAMRSKESSDEYRYFPEPDLGDLDMPRVRLETLRGELPELPWAVRRRFVDALRLDPEAARLLAESRELAAYLDAAVRAGRGAGARPGALARWLRGEALHEARARGESMDDGMPPDRFAELVALVESGVISGTAGKRILGEIWGSDESPRSAVTRLGLERIADPVRLRRWLDEAIREHPVQARQLEAGKIALVGFFVGRILERSGGRADPALASRLVRDVVAGGPLR